MLIEELVESQESIKHFIESIVERLTSTLSESVKNVASLSNIGLKSIYNSYETNLGKVTSTFFNCLASIEALPVNSYRRIMGKLMDVIIKHVCDLILKVTSIGPSESENLFKFIKPLFEYERLLLKKKKGIVSDNVIVCLAIR
jgi:predicted secreted protein